MEAHHSNGKKRAAKIRPTPHLQKQKLLVLLQLLTRRLANFIELSLKLELVDVGISELAKRRLGVVFPALDHEPSGRFWGEEKHQDSL